MVLNTSWTASLSAVYTFQSCSEAAMGSTSVYVDLASSIPDISSSTVDIVALRLRFVHQQESNANSSHH